MKKILCILVLAILSNIAHAQILSSYVDFGASSPSVQKSRVITDGDENIVHVNYISTYVDSDPGTGVAMINPGSETGIAITKFNSSTEFLWSLFFEFESYTFMDIAIGPDNSITFTGSLYGSTDIDPSDGELIFESGEGNDILTARFSENGDLIWASMTESTETGSVNDVAVLSDGSTVITGWSQGITDFDPGAGEYIVDASSVFVSGFIWKLSSAGEFEWVIPYLTESMTYGKFLTIDPLDNIIVRGEFGGLVDFDPGVGEYFVESNSGGIACFVAKYSSEGAFQWAFPLETNVSFGEDCSLVQADTYGNVILSGLFYSPAIDFDPGPEEVLSVNEINSLYCFIAKYSPDGEYLWHQEGIGLTHHTLACDGDNNIFVSGMCNPNTDADHGLGIHTLNETGDHYLYCAKYNSIGQLIWAFDLYTGLGDLGLSWTSSIALNNNDLVITGLYQESLDLDPGEGETLLANQQGTTPAFIAVYSEGPCANVSLNISELVNIDCTNIQGTATVEFINGIEPYSFEWNTEETTATIYPETSGIYTVTGQEGSSCTETTSLLVNGPLIQDGFDLNPLVGAAGFSPGFASFIQVDAFNDGCEPTDGSLVLTLDPVLSIINVSPEADIVDGNVLTWNFSALTYDGEHLTPEINVITPETTELGEIIDIHISMNPTSGDYNPINNEKHYTYEVIGSYDPNAKQVYPQGAGPEGYIDNNLSMTYTVLFQNTGSAPAVNVYILDPIEENLDISTVQVIASSHSMYTEVLDNNTLKFVFNDIMLPDSTSNESESHGYVVFTIEQQSNLPAYTEIENTAGIYFDFNEPIITNTVLNTIASGVGTEEISHQHFTTYPNPALDRLFMTLSPTSLYSYEVFSSEGKMVSQGMNLSPTLGIDISKLKPALYQIKLSGTDGSYISRFVKQ